MKSEDKNSFISGRLTAPEQMESYLMVWSSRHRADSALSDRIDQMARGLAKKRTRGRRWLLACTTLASLATIATGAYTYRVYFERAPAQEEKLKHDENSPSKDPLRGCDFESRWALRR